MKNVISEKKNTESIISDWEREIAKEKGSHLNSYIICKRVMGERAAALREARKGELLGKSHLKTGTNPAMNFKSRFCLKRCLTGPSQRCRE